MVQELKRVKLDELELYLELLKKNHAEDIRYAKYKDIANLIQVNFNVVCTEQDMILLHEPTLEQDLLATEIFYKSIGLY